ncbi:MAG: diphthamide synthesis protein [archaeon]
MKVLFIETRYKSKIKLPKKIIEKLPRKIGLFFTAQLLSNLESVKKEIEKTGREVKLFKTKHTKYLGQIYGCNLEKFSGVDAFLYIGDGLFHPKALVLGNNVPVHIYNPTTHEYLVLTKESMKDELRRQKAGYAMFLTKSSIGVLISTKMGQSYLPLSMNLKTKYPDKKFYFIVYDTIDVNSLQDFPFIEVWVNTACPRIGWDDTKRIGKPMVDIGTVL